MIANLYFYTALLGASSMWAALIWGFRFKMGGPLVPEDYYYNIGLYLVWAAVHLVMTRAWFKKTIFGKAEGSQIERLVYVSVSIATWLLVLYLHRPLSGPYWGEPHLFARFFGLCGVLAGLVAFFEGSTFDMMKGFFGTPGTEMSHSHGAETPLMTEGSYASVRHPMYRGAFIAGCFSVLLHPNIAQALWAGMIVATFVLFIPFEERQLVAARGDEYREYMKKTPYRLIKGLW